MLDKLLCRVNKTHTNSRSVTKDDDKQALKVLVIATTVLIFYAVWNFKC